MFRFRFKSVLLCRKSNTNPIAIEGIPTTAKVVWNPQLLAVSLGPHNLQHLGSLLRVVPDGKGSVTTVAQISQNMPDASLAYLIEKYGTLLRALRTFPKTFTAHKCENGAVRVQKVAAPANRKVTALELLLREVVPSNAWVSVSNVQSILPESARESLVEYLEAQEGVYVLSEDKKHVMAHASHHVPTSAPVPTTVAQEQATRHVLDAIDKVLLDQSSWVTWREVRPLLPASIREEMLVRSVKGLRAHMEDNALPFGVDETASTEPSRRWRSFKDSRSGSVHYAHKTVVLPPLGMNTVTTTTASPAPQPHGDSDDDAVGLAPELKEEVIQSLLKYFSATVWVPFDALELVLPQDLLKNYIRFGRARIFQPPEDEDGVQNFDGFIWRLKLTKFSKRVCGMRSPAYEYSIKEAGNQDEARKTFPMPPLDVTTDAIVGLHRRFKLNFLKSAHAIRNCFLSYGTVGPDGRVSRETEFTEVDIEQMLLADESTVRLGQYFEARDGWKVREVVGAFPSVFKLVSEDTEITRRPNYVAKIRLEAFFCSPRAFFDKTAFSCRMIKDVRASHKERKLSKKKRHKKLQELKKEYAGKIRTAEELRDDVVKCFPQDEAVPFSEMKMRLTKELNIEVAVFGSIGKLIRLFPLDFHIIELADGRRGVRLGHGQPADVEVNPYVDEDFVADELLKLIPDSGMNTDMLWHLLSMQAQDTLEQLYRGLIGFMTQRPNLFVLDKNNWVLKKKNVEGDVDESPKAP
eukprot:PhM_4_TR1183/c0_g2_i1/m.69054